MEAQKKEWMREQEALQQVYCADDKFDWTLTPNCPNTLKYVAGMDISFIKDNTEDACAMLVVLEYPSLKLVYERYKMVKLTLPYMSGFLAFREAPHFVALLEELEATHPEWMPQVIVMDGNGILHPRGMGIATHLGILMDIPSIGVAKKLLCFDGMEPDAIRQAFIQRSAQKGDAYKLIGESGKCHGVAFKSTAKGTQPLYVSNGHRINLSTAVQLVRTLCPHRIPEPIRLADLGSRAVIRDYLASSTTAHD